MEPKTPKRKHLNADQRRALKTASLQRFVQEYGRKQQKHVGPNDRRYKHKIERLVNRTKPDDLDQLLRDDEE